MSSWLLLIMLALPWLGGVLIALLRLQRRPAGLLALAAMVGSSLALMGLGLGRPEAPNAAVSLPWIPVLGVRFALRCDDLALPFVINVLVVSLAALWYGQGYLRPRNPHLCYALILAFTGSMLGTLLADDALLFFVFWEAILVSSSLLLMGWGEGDRVGPITLKYFIYTQVGSLLLLIAISWMIATMGASGMEIVSGSAAQMPRTRLLVIAAIMIVGFSIKMGIAPLHSWLPDAHSIAPMPVTILLAAAMLSMGAYGLLRFVLPLLSSAAAAATWQLPVMLLALASQVYGALMCLATRQIKRIIAYSSVSQMGYVLFAIASLTPQGMAGGVFHVLNHGILKALLFMDVGIIMRATGRQQIDELGGLSYAMPIVIAPLITGVLGLAGVPPFCAFHSEWMILSGGLLSGYPLLGYLEFLVPILTTAYALWFAMRLILGPRPTGLQVDSSPRAMHWSAYALALLALLVGLYPNPFYAWAERAMVVLAPGGLP